MPGPGSGQACGREVGVHFSFQDQVSDNQAVRNWTSIFFQIPASDNHAVWNWTFWSCNHYTVLSSGSRFWQSCSQEFEVHFLFKSFRTSCSQVLICWFFATTTKFEDSWHPRHLCAMSRRFAGRPPPLSTHPSGKYWGKPPALTPPGHKGKGKANDDAVSAPQGSICDTIDHSNLRGILRDLCYWQNHVKTVEELTGKVTSADWYPLLLDKLAESVIVISGAPNVGKSSLAVHLAKTLGLTRTKTTSRNFWLFARNKRPYFSFWIYCTDSFWDEEEPAWNRMMQSLSSVTSNEEFSTGAVILEGHRIFAFPGYAEVCTTVVYLAATDKLLIERETDSGSIRKHKLFISNVLDQLQELKKMITLEGDKSLVYLVCQALQITLLDDAALDASHLSADIELDGRWTFWHWVGREADWKLRKHASEPFHLVWRRQWELVSELQSSTPCKFSWCVSADLASQGWLREFCSRFAIIRQSRVQFPGFTFYWPTFGFPLTSANFLGCDNHRVSLRQLQISEQDNHGVQRKFAFSRRFVRGSVGTPVGIPSISSNHWIHCLAPFILDLGSSRTSDCVRLCYSDHPFGY